MISLSRGKDKQMAKYSLIGVNRNAFALMGYTAKALKREGLGNLVDQMYAEAKSGDYNNLVCVCDEYVDKANEAANSHGYIDEDEDEEDEFYD